MFFDECLPVDSKLFNADSTESFKFMKYFFEQKRVLQYKFKHNTNDMCIKVEDKCADNTNYMAKNIMKYYIEWLKSLGHNIANQFAHS